MVLLVSVSLSAVDQIQGSKERSRKRMWFLFLSVSSLLALYQTAQVISDYFQIRMSSSLTDELATDTFENTICFGNPTNIKNNINNTNAILLKMKGLDFSCNITSPSLFCLSLLTERERFEIGFDVRNQYVVVIKDKVVKSIFNNLHYGNCITIQSEEFFYDTWMSLESHSKLQLFFHETETLPVLKPEDEMERSVEQEISVVVHFKKTIYVDKTWASNRACATERPIITGWNNFYESVHKKSYNYSKKGCLDQCLYNLTLTYCQCIIPHSMIGENVQRIPICTRICNKIPREKLDTMCDCKTPCQNLEVNVETIQSEIDELGPQSIDMTSAASMELYNKSFGSEPFANPSNKSGEVFLRYSLTKSFMANVEYKQPQLKVEDVLSNIGGTWGLWIGLSCSILLTTGLKTIFNAHKKFSKNIIHIFYNFINSLGLIFIGSACVWQTYITIDDYLKYKVLSIETIEPQDLFPTIYVCSHPSIYIEDVDNVTLRNNHMLAEKLETLKALLGNYKFHLDPLFDLYYTSVFTKEEKLLLVPKVSDFMIKCELVGDFGLKLPCIYDRYTVLDGLQHIPTVCALINPQRANHNGERLRITNLNMRVGAVRNNFYAGQQIQAKIGLNPFIAFTDIEMSRECFKNKFTVEPGDLVEATFTLTERRRLPAPYASKCVSENSKYPKFTEFTENEFSFNYSYTYEECLHYCLLEEFKLNATLTEQEVKDCICHQPCTEKAYELKVIKKNFFSKKKMNPDQFHNVENFLDYLWNGSAEIRISRESYTKKLIKEKPAIDPFNLVGMLGGITGLWLGQSILSFIMEIQLMTTTIMEKFKKKFNKKNNIK